MAKNRNENEILKDLLVAKQEFAKVASDRQSTQEMVENAGSAVKKLHFQLDEYLSKGANSCACGIKPMGMLKTPTYSDRGVDFPNIWEIGCIHCPPFLVEREDGTPLVIDGEVKKVKRRSLSARAFVVDEVTRKWNEQEWVEDTLFDRIPGFIPVYAEEGK